MDNAYCEAERIKEIASAMYTVHQAITGYLLYSREAAMAAQRDFDVYEAMVNQAMASEVGFQPEQPSLRLNLTELVEPEARAELSGRVSGSEIELLESYRPDMEEVGSLLDSFYALFPERRRD